jgi:hypothetical protein
LIKILKNDYCGISIVRYEKAAVIKLKTKTMMNNIQWRKINMQHLSVKGTRQIENMYFLGSRNENAKVDTY